MPLGFRFSFFFLFKGVLGSIFFSFAKLTNSVKAESVIFADHWVSNKGHTQYLSQSRYSTIICINKEEKQDKEKEKQEEVI